MVVNVEIGEIVEPDKCLRWKDCEELQVLLYRNGKDETDASVICELFSLTEDGVIHKEDIPYNSSRYTPKTPILIPNGFSQPDKTEDDYKQELGEFIASTRGNGYYEFDVERLRPNECRWLCCGMLIRPVDGIVKVHYQIQSAYSMGNLSDTLEMKIS